MVVRIRLSRFGHRNNPIYNIVVSQARTARDSKPMEVLGTYDPKPRIPLASHGPSTANTTTQSQETPAMKRYKDIRIDISRTKYWLGVGAQPSEPVERLLVLMGLMVPKPKKMNSRNVSKQDDGNVDIVE